MASLWVLKVTSSKESFSERMSFFGLRVSLSVQLLTVLVPILLTLSLQNAYSVYFWDIFLAQYQE
jgi:hypothetical protein